MDYRALLGLFAILIAIVSYISYFRTIFRGETHPHAFSWLIWGILNGIGFAGQLADRAGPGAWVNGFTAVLCFTIFVIALERGEKHITTFDWLCLSGAGLALLLWGITRGPLLSVILITITDAVGFLPTFRKSFYKPHDENALTYSLSATKYVVSLVALSHVSVITALFPTSLVIMNGLFVGMLIVRRTQLSAQHATTRRGSGGC